MSGAGLASFAEGFAGSYGARKDRQADAEQAARQDKMIAALGALPPAGSTPGYAAPGVPSGAGGFGYAGAGQPGGAGDGSLFGLIDQHEGAGRYDTLFGHAQNGGRFDDVDVSRMTIDQLSEFAAPDGEYGQWVKGKVGRVATPMGRHQIVGTTLRNTAAAMGLPGDTVFNGGTQDTMASYLASQRLKSASSPAGKRTALRAEWEGFKNVSDADLDAAIAKFEAGGGRMPSRALGAPPQSTGSQL